VLLLLACCCAVAAIAGVAAFTTATTATIGEVADPGAGTAESSAAPQPPGKPRADTSTPIGAVDGWYEALAKRDLSEMRALTTGEFTSVVDERFLATLPAVGSYTARAADKLDDNTYRIDVQQAERDAPAKLVVTFTVVSTPDGFRIEDYRETGDELPAP
jgi:hypothetical protein